MTSYDFRTAVEYALSYHDAGDLIQGVKQAVFDELRELDPTAGIENTPYYNHTFIPDFILSWNESGQKTDRQVFLRPSMLSATAGRDVENLGSSAPVLLALRPSSDPDVEGSAVLHIADAPDVLLTDVNAVAQIARRTDSTERNPLHLLVKNNLVRGGRGLITSGIADQVNYVIDRSGDGVSGIREFARMVGNLFVADAATRLERAAQLLEMGITGNLSPLRKHADGPAQAIAGRLSNAEVRALLPYLLSRTEITDDPTYWSHLGSMLTLDLLEDLAYDLAGLDLDPLVVSNLASWQATRALVSADDEIYDPITGRTSGVNPHHWHFDAKMLSIVVRGWRIHVTPNSRRLRAHDRAVPVPWDEIAEQLRRFQLSGVVLSGTQRRVGVSSEAEADVYDDVQAIRQSVEDDFQVPEVTIRIRGGDSDAEVVVNFPAMLATASSAVPAAELVDIAMGLLARDGG
jgi:hypothetical protein